MIFAFFNLCLNLVVVLVFGLIQGVRPMLSWLEMIPLIVGMLVVFCTGLAMLLSARVRLLPGSAADLGGRQPDHVLRLGR